MQSGIRIAAAFAFLFLLGSTADVGSVPKKYSPNLEIELGPSGRLSSWLQLGPFRAPGTFKQNPVGVFAYDPIDPSDENLKPTHGGYARAAMWRASFSSENGKTNLGVAKMSVCYLAVQLRAAHAKTIWLSTGSDDGLEIWLNHKPQGSADRIRRAKEDIELTRLSLRKGDNLLFLKLTKIRKGPWGLFARLMEEDFNSLNDVTLSLPGAGPLSGRILSSAGKLELKRSIDLNRGTLGIRADLVFPGGRPKGGFLTGRVSFEGPGSVPSFEKKIDFSAPGSSMIPVWDAELQSEKGPSKLALELLGKRFGGRLGFFMRDVKALSRAFTNLERSRNINAIPKSSFESAAWRIAHLKKLIESGDEDYKYLRREIKKTIAITETLAAGRDYYGGVRGRVQRRGFKSSINGSYSHYALYVPAKWREEGDQRFGLVVTLHGLRGSPMKAMQDVFGLPLEEGESQKKRSRFPKRCGPSKFFVLAPSGFGSAGYVGFAEVDVLEAIGEVQQRYRIDPRRVFITGTSMGGTGAARIPLHYPDRFASAVSLAGYHSLFERRGFKGDNLHPFEKFLAGFMSNANWAENGRDLPLYLVHGLKDMPRYSKVLHDRYRELGHSVKLELPESEHNVWDETYNNRRIFRHFDGFTRNTNPHHLRFITYRLRYRSRDWIQIDGALDYAAPSDVTAQIEGINRIVIATENVAAITVFNDFDKKFDQRVLIRLDGEDFDVDWDWPFWQFHRLGKNWRMGSAPKCGKYCKRPGLAGPIDDVFYEPLLFVYGTSDAGEEMLSRRIIKKIKRVKKGVTVNWPVKADTEVTAADIANHSVVLVGTMGGNKFLRRIANALPIRVSEDGIDGGDRKHLGRDLAASFVYPNPLNPDRYVLVHTGTSTRALYTAAHLPKLLPDYIIYDASTWNRAGGYVLGDRKILEAGFFDSSWNLQ